MGQNPMKQVLANAAALDERRQEQIAEQVKVINRVKARGDRAEEYIASIGKSDEYERWLGENYPADAEGDTAATD